MFANAIEYGDITRATDWLDAGLDPDYFGSRIGSGLMIAAWTGNLEMIRLFLSRGADVNKGNERGEQALMHAAYRGHAQAVELLLFWGAKLDSPPMQWSALHYAVFAGHAGIARALLAKGADLNARSTNGSSVLMMAVYEGHEDLVRDLLARGADTGIRNDRGDGAMEWAFKFRRLGIARMIAEGDSAKFAAAASKPAQDWGPALRSVPAPAAAGSPAAPGTPPAAASPLSERAAQLAELRNIRAILAQRGMGAAVKKLDARIVALRARQAKDDVGLPEGGTVLEITARRDRPEEQSTQLIDATAPPP